MATLDKQRGIWIAVGIALLLVLIVGVMLNYTQDMNNLFQYQYAKFTSQFLSQDQVAFFTNVYYPLNDQQTLSNYYSMLNGTLAPQFINMTRYIVGNQTSLLPLTSSYALSSLYPYIISPNSLIYANNKANIPTANSTFYYVYPLYEAKYVGNCSEMTPQDMQIQTIINPMISFSSTCTPSSNYMNFTAVVGVSNNTETIVDGTFQQLNPSYTSGISYLYPLVPASDYNNNQAVANSISISNTSLSTLNATYATPSQAQQDVSTVFSINITDNVSLSSITWYANNTQIASSTFPANTTNATTNVSYTYGYIGNLPLMASITDANNNTANITTNIYFYPDTPLSGTLQGYVASQSFPFAITNASADQQSVFPTRNIYSGSFQNGSAFIDNLYCWNENAYPQLTNQLQNLGYSQYPYLYQYQYNTSQYLCLSVNSTNVLINASANIDNSNVSLNPVVPNLFSLYPDYLIANATAIQENFAYLTNGTSTSEPTSMTSPYWFMPNETYQFSITPSPDYIYTEIMASQYYISNMLPIHNQEPSYTPITLQNGASAVVTNVTTYLYTPLIQNLTYQYQFNQPSTGTPVYCTNICEYNGSIVYQDYQYDYQYASPDFGYVVLPQLNQTLYYTPQFSMIATTPLINNTDQFSSNYGKLCLYSGSIYTCQYGLSPSQMFNDGNVNTFIIYQRINQNATYLVNGQQITGWSNFEGYLNDQLNTSKIATIARLSPSGAQEWLVSGAVESVLPSFIVISPINYNINPYGYPSAQPLTYSTTSILIFVVMMALIPYMAYIMAKTRIKG